MPPPADAGLTAGQWALFLRATGVTVVISVLSMALAVAGGLGLSLARRYGGGVLRVAASTYVEVFRGTPGAAAALRHLLRPRAGDRARRLHRGGARVSVSTTRPTSRSCTAPGSRPCRPARPRRRSRSACRAGRRWAASSCRRRCAWRCPGIANDFIALLKDTSLVSVITVVELTKQMTITAVQLQSWLVPGLLCAALYLALSWPLGRLARRLERRLMPAPA